MSITCAILSFKSADGWPGRGTDETSNLTYKKRRNQFMESRNERTSAENSTQSFR